MEAGHGSIRIAPAVLRQIVSLTALAVPGVSGLSSHITDGMRDFLSRGRESSGVKIQVRQDEVFVDLHVSVESGADVLEVGRRIQRDVAEAVDAMVGLPVREVNVYVQEVS